MNYIIQELIRGNIKIRGGQEEALEIIKNYMDEQIPITITYKTDTILCKEI